MVESVLGDAGNAVLAEEGRGLVRRKEGASCACKASTRCWSSRVGQTEAEAVLPLGCVLRDPVGPAKPKGRSRPRPQHGDHTPLHLCED